MIRRSSLLLAIALIATSAGPGFAAQPGPVGPIGAVYTMSNDANGNSILAFDRFFDGRLQPAFSVTSGGNGSGHNLGNQGGLTLTANQHWLLAVNAGSDSVSVLEVGLHSLRLVGSGKTGHMPVSVTVHGDLVYALNGGSETIQGFRLDRTGQLHPIKGSMRKLADIPGTQPAQIGFNPEGEFLVVTEKATSKILTFPLGTDGTPRAPVVQDSNGVTPFGFAFGKRDQLLVAEAFAGASRAGATSSYVLGDDGILTTISASTRDNQSGTRCTVVTPSGEFAYVSNTGSGTISGYSIDFDGNLNVLDAAGVTAVTDGKPLDLALTGSGRFLYGLIGGSNEIAAFHVELDGALTPLRSGATRLPATADGLAVR